MPDFSLSLVVLVELALDFRLQRHILLIQSIDAFLELLDARGVRKDLIGVLRP